MSLPTFEEAFETFSKIVKDNHHVRGKLTETKAHLLDLERQLKYREADALINGDISGSNAEQRKASLLLSLEGDPSYQDLLDAIRVAQQEVGTLEADLDAGATILSAMRRVMDWHTALENSQNERNS